MATAAKRELPRFALGDNWEITNARSLEYGTYFTLKMPGLSLYNLRVVPAGKTYDSFVAMPEEKGSDGNYHKQYALYLTKEDNDAVIEAVQAALEEENKPRRKR